MHELVRVNYESEQPTILARDLHDFLGAETPYRLWFPRMCEYGFIEGIDYTPYIFVHPQNGQETIDRQLTLDMAKELCMLQRNEKGKQARQYFLQIERAWNDPDKVIERAQKILAARVAKLEAHNSSLQLQLDQAKQWYTIKRVAQINRIDWRELSWQRLKNTSDYLEVEIQKVFDANYGTVNAYHVDVWQNEYPELTY